MNLFPVIKVTLALANFGIYLTSLCYFLSASIHAYGPEKFIIAKQIVLLVKTTFIVSNF